MTDALQKMDKDWMGFHPDPRKPDFVPPKGAVDAHCHVFGPASQFPFADMRKYTPCDAGKEQLFALRDHLGFSRNVIVQASCHGRDNAALVDVLKAADDLARGIVVVGPDVTDEELALMDKAGVRGVRFNFVKRLVDATPKQVFLDIAERVKKLGWHIVVYFEAADQHDLIPFLKQLPTVVVVDHMGRPDVSKLVEQGGFQEFITLLAENDNFWTKVTCPERLTLTGRPMMM